MHDRSHIQSEFARVIRHRSTRAFFAAGDWTPDYEIADKFSDTFSVLKAHQQHKLANVELVLVLGAEPTSYDIALPLD